MDTTADSFKITLSDIARHAVKLGMLADGVRLEYRHNGAGHPPYVYAIAADGSTDDSATAAMREFLPVFTGRFTRRESMAALEACERTLGHVARIQTGQGMGSTRELKAWDTAGKRVELTLTDYEIRETDGRLVSFWNAD